MLRGPLFRLVLAAAFFAPSTIVAQVGGGFGGGLGGAGGGFGNAGGGGGNQNSAGIKIDAQGVLSLVIANDGSGLLDKKRHDAVSQKISFARRQSASQTEIRFPLVDSLRSSSNKRLQNSSRLPPKCSILRDCSGSRTCLRVSRRGTTSSLPVSAEGFVPDAIKPDDRRRIKQTDLASGRSCRRTADRWQREATWLFHRPCTPAAGRVAKVRSAWAKPGQRSKKSKNDSIRWMKSWVSPNRAYRRSSSPILTSPQSLVEADYRMKRIAIGLEMPAVKGMKSHLTLIGARGNTIQLQLVHPLLRRHRAQ